MDRWVEALNKMASDSPASLLIIPLSFGFSPSYFINIMGDDWDGEERVNG
jgi:hypothetical protein